jgi:glycosyltransferase involved in cell wall biosynthesis
MSFPLISIIIPVFNREAFLPELLENIFAQNYFPLEIIVVDDGSTDGSAALIKSYPRVNYIYQTNKGPSAARNTGLAAATGEFIAFIDSDDLWADENLLALSKCLINNQHADIAEGLIQEVNLTDSADSKIISTSPFYNCLLGSCLIRKSILDKVGYFNEQLLYTEDVDWFIRAWEINATKQRIPIISLYYRKHKSNMTNNSVNCIHYRLLLYKIKITRQKNQLHLPLPKGKLKNFLGDLSVDTNK